MGEKRYFRARERLHQFHFEGSLCNFPIQTSGPACLGLNLDTGQRRSGRLIWDVYHSH